MPKGWTLGIESTAHTLSFGLVDGKVRRRLQILQLCDLTKAVSTLAKQQTTTRMLLRVCFHLCLKKIKSHLLISLQ
jgi:hypothetical protein